MHPYTHCLHKVIFSTPHSVSVRISKDTLEKTWTTGKLRNKNISSSLQVLLYGV